MAQSSQQCFLVYQGPPIRGRSDDPCLVVWHHFCDHQREILNSISKNLTNEKKTSYYIIYHVNWLSDKNLIFDSWNDARSYQLTDPYLRDNGIIVEPYLQIHNE